MAVDTLTYKKQQDPEVLDIANKLAEAHKRNEGDKSHTPHNEARNILIEAGGACLNHPDLYRNFIDSITAINEQSQAQIT